MKALSIDCEAVKANQPGNYKHVGAGAGGSGGAGAGAHTCATNMSRIRVTKGDINKLTKTLERGSQQRSNKFKLLLLLLLYARVREREKTGHEP